MAKDTMFRDDKLGWKPHPDSRSVLEEFRHITFGLEFSSAHLRGEKFNFVAREKADAGKPKRRASMVSEMEAAIAISYPLVEKSPTPLPVGWIEDQAEHYGKLVSAYRSIGSVPPISRKRFAVGATSVRGMIDGVATTPALRWTALPAEAGVRLDKFLASPDRLGSRARAATALERGKVFVNDQEVSLADAGRRLAAEDEVRVWQDRPGSAKGRTALGRTTDLDVVYEDSDIVVVNKPPGILTVPLERRPTAPSVYGQIVERLRSHGKRKPFVVHRIDRDTSGLVLFARTTDAQLHLKAQFKARTADRVYLAVVYGHPQPAQGTWRDVLVWDEKALIQKETHPRDPRGTTAVSRYRTLETFADAALIEVQLESGRRNQIRLQARLRGHALVGEQRYVFGPENTRPIKFGRQALHARHLALEHPSDGRRLEFEAPMPQDIQQLLNELRRG